MNRDARRVARRVTVAAEPGQRQDERHQRLLRGVLVIGALRPQHQPDRSEHHRRDQHDQALDSRRVTRPRLLGKRQGPLELDVRRGAGVGRRRAVVADPCTSDAMNPLALIPCLVSRRAVAAASKKAKSSRAAKFASAG